IRDEGEECPVRIHPRWRPIDGERCPAVADRTEDEIRVARLDEVLSRRINDLDRQRAFHQRDRRQRRSRRRFVALTDWRRGVGGGGRTRRNDRRGGSGAGCGKDYGGYNRKTHGRRLGRRRESEKGEPRRASREERA